MKLNTKQKIALAKAAHRVVRAGRGLTGRGMQGVFRRSGLSFDLNLDEGIDFAIYLLGAFEPEVVRYYDRILKPGDVVLDVGANVGAHTVQFAKRVAPGGMVYAFEPTDYAFGKLMRNTELNSELAPLIRASQVFLNEGDGELVPESIYSSWPLEGGGEELHHSHQGELRETAGAAAISLDAFCDANEIARADFMKLDVDGHEIAVLRGARKVLGEIRPKILMEVSPEGFSEMGYEFSELVEIIRDADLKMTDVATGTEMTVTEEAIRRYVPAGGGVNVLLTRD